MLLFIFHLQLLAVSEQRQFLACRKRARSAASVSKRFLRGRPHLSSLVSARRLASCGCAWESHLPSLGAEEHYLHEFALRNTGWHLTRAAKDEEIASTSMCSQQVYRQAFSQVAGYHRNGVPCYHLFPREGLEHLFWLLFMQPPSPPPKAEPFACFPFFHRILGTSAPKRVVSLVVIKQTDLELAANTD